MRPTLPQKFHLAYHLVVGGGQLWTPLLAHPTAPEALHGMGQVREAWTDVGKNAVVQRACLGRSDKFSQVSVHLGVDPVYDHSINDERTVTNEQRTSVRCTVTFTTLQPYAITIV